MTVHEERVTSLTPGILELSQCCLMEDDLNITEAILLDRTTAILYVGWCSAGEGLMEGEAQACLEHFSPFVKWRGMAVEWDFQALTLAGDWEVTRAHKAQCQKTLRGHGRPRVTWVP